MRATRALTEMRRSAMPQAMRSPNVFTISPALPILDTFVEAFLAGEIVEGVAAGLGLADATIYVPTRRAAAALGDAFLARSPDGAAILPRILPLGALEATETSLIFAESDPAAAGLPLPPAASPIWRRLRLATLIQEWSRAIQGALCSVDSTGVTKTDPIETFRVATSTVDAFALAGDLAGLIDEMRIEGVAWRELDALQMAGFDDYWRITTTFLSIAVDAWPRVLTQAGLVDPAERQIALVDAQARMLAEGPVTGPVVAIGSTGTNKATARLLAAIARARRGAVVLPGLDREIDDAAWSMIAGKLAADEEPSFGHPHAAMARLLPILGAARADVRPLGTLHPARALKAQLVAEALRPADTTDQWRGFRRAHPQKTLAQALTGVSLIEAADEREEALCIAIAMRAALEISGRTAALVTPDRELARRVRGELLRWNIEVDDTGGEPLARRPLGTLARLVASAAASDLAARDLGALLAHPLAGFGLPRADVARRGAQLEVGVLRVVSMRGRDATRLFAEARAAAADPHAHAAQRALTEADWAALVQLWDVIIAVFAPLRALAEAPRPLATWVETHRRALATIAEAGAPDEIAALDGLFDELLAGDTGTLRFDAADYDLFIGRLLHEVVLRNTDRPHPRLQILGLLEARLLRADLMLLGGLDETIWPPQARTDPFLNRPMRHELGLSSPERRIGQTAHDFEQAMGNDTVVLSRALKRAGAPTVASRFLLRLEALTGKAWDEVKARGHATRELARRLDWTKAPVAILRPRPTPSVALRPQALSVTQIETLRRDPYSIYASHVLRLAPLPQVGEDVEAGIYGSLIHAALHRFALDAAATADEATRRTALLAILRETFAVALVDPTFATFRWPSIEKSAEVFLAFDAGQRATAREIVTETSGKLALTLADQSAFVLRARADRIDLHRDGSATLVDYKTGQPPGNREVEVGFAPQLTLEAAILQASGFELPAPTSSKAVYLKLGGKDGGRARDVIFEDASFAEVVERHLDGLVRLLSSFRHLETAYPSRPFPKFAKSYGDFDHLARVREWSLTGDDEMPT